MAVFGNGNGLGLGLKGSLLVPQEIRERDALQRLPPRRFALTQQSPEPVDGVVVEARDGCAVGAGGVQRGGDGERGRIPGRDETLQLLSGERQESGGDQFLGGLLRGALVRAAADGANVLPLLSIAGLGIAFRAKPLVKASAKQSISNLGLDAILYMMGFSDRDVRQ